MNHDRAQIHAHPLGTTLETPENAAKIKAETTADSINAVKRRDQVRNGSN